MQHVVEVGDVGDVHAGRPHCGVHTGGPVLVERLAQVEGVGDRVEHRFGGDVRQVRMDRRRQFDAVRSDGTGEVEPFLDGEIGVGIPAIAWRQLLEGGGEYADRHVDGLEWLGRHGKLLRLDGLRLDGATVGRGSRRADGDGLVGAGGFDRCVEDALGLQGVGEVGHRDDRGPAADHREDVGRLIDEAVLVTEAMAVGPPRSRVGMAVAAAGDVDRRPTGGAPVSGRVVVPEFVHALEVEPEGAALTVDLEPVLVVEAGGQARRLERRDAATAQPGQEGDGVVDGARPHRRSR